MPVNVTYEPKIFENYIEPAGFLTELVETHALFYYYIIASSNYDQENHGVVYEGEKDPEFNYRQLFISIAKIYGVDPHHMENAWPEVKKQIHALGLKPLPDTAKYMGLAT